MIAKNLTLYTAAHLVIDMVCMWTMFFIFLANPADGIKFALIYNFFAFAFQPVVGMFADAVRRPKEITAASFILMALGLALFSKFAVAGAVIIGVANAAFHVGAGIIVYNLNPNTPKWQGVYISSGGIGLAVGALLANTGVQSVWLFIILAIFFVLTLITKAPQAAYAMQKVKLDKKVFAGIFILVVTAIFIRSLTGFDVEHFAESAADKWYLVLIVALGKAVGGFSYEKAGMLKGIILPLFAAAVLLFFAFVLVGAAAISMTTGVTLYFLFLLMPRRPGLAFGFNCLALFIGFVVFLFAGGGFGPVLTAVLLLVFTPSVYMAHKRLNYE